MIIINQFKSSTFYIIYETENYFALNTNAVASPAMGHWSTCPPSTSNNFIFSSLWSKSESQLSKYFVVCEISWCRCQQLTVFLISTALVTKLLVIKQLLHPAVKSTLSAPWHNISIFAPPRNKSWRRHCALQRSYVALITDIKRTFILVNENRYYDDDDDDDDDDDSDDIEDP